MRAPRLFLFDIDGTLVYFRGAGRRAALTAFREIFQIPDPESLTRGVHLAGSTDSKIMRELAEACGVPAGQYDLRQEDVRARYLHYLNDEIAAFDADPILPGVLPLLTRLNERPDCHLALLTGNYETGARIKLEPTGLNPFFPVGGYGDDHEDRRVVARVAFERACQHHRVKPSPTDVYVIGDTVHDVDCAKANGFQAVAVCTGQYSRDQLHAAGADVVLDTLDTAHDAFSLSIEPLR